MNIEYFLHSFKEKFKKYEKRSWGLLCNQTSWSFQQNKYLYEILDELGVLKRVFLPEHGLFAELQDQIGLDDGSIYKKPDSSLEFVSLYGSKEATLFPDNSVLSDLQVILVDISDVGSRYYTFATTLSYLFQKLSQSKQEIEIIIIERPNPAGRQVEGSRLPPEFESFVGFPGLLHRHGLSIGELARYYKDSCQATFRLEIVYDPKTYLIEPGHPNRQSVFDINPSPNMPNMTTAHVYSGQCLWEGTNLSEGRGTTRPFEIFGAPNLHKKISASIPTAQGARLRPLRFIPTFHKHKDRVCDGWQIHLDSGDPYHSLLHSLQMMRFLHENDDDFAWRSAEYEFISDRPAIEILAGDDLILDYLKFKTSLKTLREYLRECEQEWIVLAENWKIHKAAMTAVY